MAIAGAFLGSAKGRLLPPSLPFRFFGAALVFHLLAWLALLAGAGRWPRAASGPGWPLAALHALTLGVLLMSAIGASLQLLPVATRQALVWPRALALLWWLYTPGVAALAAGMGLGAPALLASGAAAVALALLVYALLLAVNLRGARGMPAVVLHGWAALACLLLALAAAAALVLGWLGVPVFDHAGARALHLGLASYGFMGLMALGLSYILVPMFALAQVPDERQAIASWAFALAALVLAVLAATGLAPQPLRLGAIALGAVALALHLRLMRRALASGMRREFGRSFMLVRLGWSGAAASLPLALALVLETPLPGLATLFALVLVGGWLLSFLLGMLQRILPFLASMHAARGPARSPTPSSLSAPLPLAVHFHCHWAALAGLALAVLADSAALAALAAGAGAVGAAALLVHFATLLRRMRGAGGAA